MRSVPSARTTIATASCGQPDLDRFFEHYAGQDPFELHLAVTCVAIAQTRTVATVAASSIERSIVPNARLRRRLPAYPLPVLRRARLGVDARAQGLGIGSAPLRHLSSLAVKQRDRMDCVGVVTGELTAFMCRVLGRVAKAVNELDRRSERGGERVGGTSSLAAPCAAAAAAVRPPSCDLLDGRETASSTRSERQRRRPASWRRVRVLGPRRGAGG